MKILVDVFIFFVIFIFWMLYLVFSGFWDVSLIIILLVEWCFIMIYLKEFNLEIVKKVIDFEF